LRLRLRLNFTINFHYFFIFIDAFFFQLCDLANHQFKVLLACTADQDRREYISHVVICRHICTFDRDSLRLLEKLKSDLALLDVFLVN